MRRRRWCLVAAAACLATACSDVLVGAPAATDYGSMFDDLWRQVDLHYSYFDLARVDWNAVGAQYRPQAVSAGNDGDFARALAGMLAELKDVHVSITPGDRGNTMRYLSRFDTTATYFDQYAVLNQYVPAAQITPSGHVRYGRIADSIGYVRISRFDGDGWASDIDRVIESLPGLRTLIVDVRDNPGGNYELAAAIAGRFTDKSRLFGYIRRRSGPRHDDFTGYIGETVVPSGVHFTGRTFVLTNRRSFSSAEDFSLAMRSIPGVTTVGDTTGGATGGPIVRELANGWTYQISEWIEYTPERVAFEGVGLAPTVYVKSSPIDSTHGTDAVLERTLRLARRP